MTSIVEVRHDPVSTAKSYARKVSKEQIIIPRYNQDIVNGRWHAIYSGKNRILSGDEEKVVREMLSIISNMNRITTQREVWYMIRGNHPDWTYKGLDMKDSKVYDAITGPLMESVQLSTNHTMQSLGVWAGPRGYVTGDGTITTAVRGTFPLSAMPALSFDLVDVDVQVNSKARKIIHFEKDAGFQGLATQEVCKMIESQFSTSQGYLVEAANKYLADCQRRGLNIYVVHDSDAHGIQMALMYGMSSKSSSYMPSSFYPYPNTTHMLGLFPSVAQALGLPPEEISETSQRILPNVQKLCDSHPEMQTEIDILVDENKQWEFQALSGRGEKASIFYLLESLRASEDEIKYVPSADKCKKSILDAIKIRKDNYVEWYINSFIDDWFNRSGGLKDQLKAKLREKLQTEIDQFQKDADEGYEKLEDVDEDDYREAIKMKLVDYPVQYATDAMTSIAYELTDYKFKITSEPEITVDLDEETGVEVEATTNDLELPEEPLTKDDIIESIESRIISDDDERNELQTDLRKALETKFSSINVEW